MPAVEVLRTYLALESPSDFKPSPCPDPHARVESVHAAPASFFRYLYVEVGRAYHWVDRLAWTDDQLRERLAKPGVSLHLLSVAGAPAGYFELEKHEDGSVEVAYFGLLPEFLGRGLGGYLLSEAVVAAWGLEPTRVWLHTCTLDARAAMPNYLARGFRPFKQESYVAQLSD
jgi:GNAT superfamily N-acetyltransferase